MPIAHFKSGKGVTRYPKNKSFTVRLK